MIAIVILYDAAQLLTTLDLTFEHWREIDVEDIVADVFAPVGPSSVVIAYPDRIDVMQMIHAEAEEIIQAFEGVIFIAGSFWSILTGHFEFLAG